MTGFLIALTVIVGIGLIRLGAEITYRGGALTVRARIAGIPITIVPREKKAKKEKKPKEKKQKKETQTAEGADASNEKKKFSFDRLKLYLKLAADILRVLKRRFPPLWRSFVITKLYLYYTVATSDAAQTAEQYGKMCAAVSAAYPVYREVLDIRHHDVTIDVDFCRDKPEIDADVRFRVTVGAVIIFAVTFAFGALVSYLRMKRAESRLDQADGHKGTNQNNDKVKDKAVQVNE